MLAKNRHENQPNEAGFGESRNLLNCGVQAFIYELNTESDDFIFIIFLF